MKLVIDIKSGQPGCVLLQTLAGCHASNSFMETTFDTKHWLVSPTDNMRVVDGTEEQWRCLARQLDARHKRGLK